MEIRKCSLSLKLTEKNNFEQFSENAKRFALEERIFKGVFQIFNIFNRKLLLFFKFFQENEEKIGIYRFLKVIVSRMGKSRSGGKKIVRGQAAKEL